MIGRPRQIPLYYMYLGKSEVCWRQRRGD